MTTLDALLAGVLAAPDDDTPRLVWADAAEEAGLGERAEFIRVQVELAKIADDEHPDLAYGGYEQYKARQDALRERERELLDAFSEGQGGGGRKWLTGPLRETYRWWGEDQFTNRAWMFGIEFRRGFVAEVACTAADWLARGDNVLKAQPVETVRLTTWPEWETRSDRSLSLRAHGRDRWHDIPLGADQVSRGSIMAKLLAAEWPGVTFELPPGPSSSNYWITPDPNPPEGDIVRPRPPA